MKNCFKLVFFCLGLLVVTFGCQKDDINEQDDTTFMSNGSSYQLRERNHKDLSCDTKFSKAMSEVLKVEKTETGFNARTIMEEEYGFTIDSTRIKEIYTDNYTSYTFLIHREEWDESYFENLVVEVDSANNVNAMIVKYILNSATTNLSEHDSFYMDAEMEVSYIDYNNTQARFTNGGCVGILMCPYQEDHSAGPSCIDQNRGDLYLNTDMCEPAAGSSDNSSSGNGDSGSTTNSGSGNNSGDDGCNDCSGSSTGTNNTTGDTGNTTTTSPVNDTPEYLRKKDFLRTYLTPAQRTWFNGQIAVVKNSITNYLENEYQNDDSLSGEYPEEAASFATEAVVAFMDDGEEAKYFAETTLEYDLDLENLILLDDLIEDDFFKLIEVDCSQIVNWQNLAQHTAPLSVANKIEELPSSLTNDFEIQSLSDAEGTMVNLDYFSINVTNLPNNPNIEFDVQFTADEMLNYMRRNLDYFVVGSTFEPYCEIESMCDTETELWDSEDPLGSIIYIDIPLDDGVVVCSEYYNNYWYFMTMNAPYAGNHPVSGTRQFGYELNADGSYNFYVRGVDRFNRNGVENTSHIIDFIFGETDAANAFVGADDLWESFQTQTNNFVNNNGGVSTTVTATKDRPDWEKVKQVLRGQLPVSDLGCED